MSAFSRPSLTDLINQAAQDLDEAGPLLRFSNLAVLGKAVANLAHLNYGYLDWIAQQSNPFTATDEYLEAWAALRKVFRKAATQATGSITFSGTVGTFLPSGQSVARTDGVLFTTTSSGTVGGAGTVTVNATANADPTGQTGAFGNTAAGTQMALATAVPGILATGVVSTAFTGGADLENDTLLRGRMIEAYQNPAQGGAKTDYIRWAKEVPGVTRAWCLPNDDGVGTVGVYIMLDDVRSAFNGFPQGTNGCATAEGRGTTATGDQLLVADYIDPLRPVTALVYTKAPTASPQNFTLFGIDSGSQPGVEAAIADVFKREGNPDGVTSVPLAHISSAVAAVSGVSAFLITSPAVDIVCAKGHIPTLGTVTFT